LDIAENELLNEPAEMGGTEPVDVIEVEAFVVVVDELLHAATNAPTPMASSAVRPVTLHNRTFLS
jgi:hypothetical protein